MEAPEEKRTPHSDITSFLILSNNHFAYRTTKKQTLKYLPRVRKLTSKSSLPKRYIWARGSKSESLTDSTESNLRVQGTLLNGRGFNKNPVMQGGRATPEEQEKLRSQQDGFEAILMQYPNEKLFKYKLMILDDRDCVVVTKTVNTIGPAHPDSIAESIDGTFPVLPHQPRNLALEQQFATLHPFEIKLEHCIWGFKDTVGEGFILRNSPRVCSKTHLIPCILAANLLSGYRTHAQSYKPGVPEYQPKPMHKFDFAVQLAVSCISNNLNTLLPKVPIIEVLRSFRNETDQPVSFSQVYSVEHFALQVKQALVNWRLLQKCLSQRISAYISKLVRRDQKRTRKSPMLASILALTDLIELLRQIEGQLHYDKDGSLVDIHSTGELLEGFFVGVTTAFSKQVEMTYAPDFIANIYNFFMHCSRGVHALYTRMMDALLEMYPIEYLATQIPSTGSQPNNSFATWRRHDCWGMHSMDSLFDSLLQDQHCEIVSATNSKLKTVVVTNRHVHKLSGTYQMYLQDYFLHLLDSEGRAVQMVRGVGISKFLQFLGKTTSLDGDLTLWFLVLVAGFERIRCKSLSTILAAERYQEVHFIPGPEVGFHNSPFHFERNTVYCWTLNYMSVTIRTIDCRNKDQLVMDDNYELPQDFDLPTEEKTLISRQFLGYNRNGNASMFIATGNYCMFVLIKVSRAGTSPKFVVCYWSVHWGQPPQLHGFQVEARTDDQSGFSVCFEKRGKLYALLLHGASNIFSLWLGDRGHLTNLVPKKTISGCSLIKHSLFLERVGVRFVVNHRLLTVGLVAKPDDPLEAMCNPNYKHREAAFVFANYKMLRITL